MTCLLRRIAEPLGQLPSRISERNRPLFQPAVGGRRVDPLMFVEPHVAEHFSQWMQRLGHSRSRIAMRLEHFRVKVDSEEPRDPFHFLSRVTDEVFKPED